MPNISLILYKLYRIKDTGVKEQQPRPPPYAYPLPEPFSPAQRLNQFCRPPRQAAWGGTEPLGLLRSA